VNCVLPPLSAVFFYSDAGADIDQIQFNDINGNGYSFNFQLGAFASPGTYVTVLGGSTSNTGTLTVQETPEPSAILMVVSGIFAIGLFYRRRKNSTVDLL
jgi:hypothetical protein